ncbi:hypothetical protein [Streptomyces sp. NBC_01264]|nr:hypothetical protein [Streptomyces sp. NBC_01264]MCX4781949.1 hypothetical protein [Streptomyces sp. NBC_01264]
MLTGFAVAVVGGGLFLLRERLARNLRPATVMALAGIGRARGCTR